MGAVSGSALKSTRVKSALRNDVRATVGLEISVE